MAEALLKGEDPTKANIKIVQNLVSNHIFLNTFVISERYKFCGAEAHLRRDCPIGNVKCSFLDIKGYVLKYSSNKKNYYIRRLSDACLNYHSPVLTRIPVNENEILIEIDTSPSISIISSRDLNLLGSHYEPADAYFVSFSGLPIKPI
ncbi:hypothetical protein HZS_3604 [Henneguya salminicola]|nr:hypothetical protein HZS_3604 [Henneguya salminicola]